MGSGFNIANRTARNDFFATSYQDQDLSVAVNLNGRRSRSRTGTIPVQTTSAANSDSIIDFDHGRPSSILSAMSYQLYYLSSAL
jgi:hypothetical protein